MASYLLDTNHLSPLVTLTHPLREQSFLRQYQGNVFAIAVPTLTETFFGLSFLSRARQNLIELNRLKAGLTIYDLDQFDAEKAAKLQVSLRRQG